MSISQSLAKKGEKERDKKKIEEEEEDLLYRAFCKKPLSGDCWQRGSTRVLPCGKRGNFA